MKHPWHMTVGEFVAQVRDLNAGIASLALEDGPFAGGLVVVAFGEEATDLWKVVRAMQADDEATKSEAG